MKNPPAKPSQLITKEFAKQLNVNYNNRKASITAKKAQKKMQMPSGIH